MHFLSSIGDPVCNVIYDCISDGTVFVHHFTLPTPWPLPPFPPPHRPCHPQRILVIH